MLLFTEVAFLAAVPRGMIAGGGFNNYLLVKAMTADSLLEVGEVYNIVDGLPFLGAKLETLNLIIKRDLWAEEYQYLVLL